MTQIKNHDPEFQRLLVALWQQKNPPPTAAGPGAAGAGAIERAPLPLQTPSNKKKADPGQLTGSKRNRAVLVVRSNATRNPAAPLRRPLSVPQSRSHVLSCCARCAGDRPEDHVREGQGCGQRARHG